MGIRNHYPTPDCPKCNHHTSTTSRTYYTEDQQIVRQRTCTLCFWRFYTAQPKETFLNPSLIQVKHPTKFRNAKDKRVKLQPVDTTPPIGSGR